MQARTLENPLKQLPEVFTSSDAIKCMKNQYRAPHKALESMVDRRLLVRLKRGVYAFPDRFDHLLAAQLMYGPSYVSFETALAEYGLIPERVEQTLSVVDGRNNTFNTTKGQFVYYSQRRDLFAKGMTMRPRDRFFVQIALPEKALFDTLMRAKLKVFKTDPWVVWEYVVSSLRIDVQDAKALSLERCLQLAPLYRTVAPALFTKALAMQI